MGSQFPALVLNSTMDTATHKAEIIYYNTMFEGKTWTIFLSFQDLSSGTASGAFSAYKHAFTATTHWTCVL